MLGLDNYQAVRCQLFNSPKATGDLAGVKVVAAYPVGSDDIAESKTSLPKWKEQIGKFGVELVDSIDELLKRCDVVMIMSLDGRNHSEAGAAGAQAKKPLYIWPAVGRVAGRCDAIFNWRKKSKTPCWSSSQHRYSPGFSGMRIIRKSARCSAAMSTAAVPPIRTPGAVLVGGA